MTITQKKIVSLHHAKVTILFEMRKKISNNSILAACVLVVLTLCLLSVWQPIHFQKEKEQRETAVKQRLMKIRTAEENYKRRHGTYTGDFATLIKGKWLDREMQYIPFSDNKRFSLSATANRYRSWNVEPPTRNTWMASTKMPYSRKPTMPTWKEGSQD